MVNKFVGKIANVKTALVGAFGVLGAGALASSSLDAFAKQERAVTSFDESLKSMGRTTKDLGPNIKALATRIQAEGIIGDEAILEGAAFLSTYGDITDALLPRTIRAMVDLAAKTGGSTTNAAKLLGKASMGLVGALSIAGISLSEATKKSKNFEDILTEIEQQVGGVNAALGAATSGALTQFGNALGDVKEQIGGVIAVAINPFLRLFTQTMAAGTIAIEKQGEALRDWGIELAKSLSWLIDFTDLLGGIWDTIKGGAGKVFSFILNSIADIQTDLNRLFGFFGAEPLVSPAVIDNLRMTAKELKNVANANIASGMGAAGSSLDRLDQMLTQGTTNVAGSGAAAFNREIDDIVNRAAVAEMKSRLGIAGGPNFAPVSGAANQQGPTIVEDPQLVEVNAKLQTMVDLFGGFGVRAQ
jgi:hypothetical protein